MSDKRSKINFYHKHDTIKGCFYDCIVLHHKHFLKGVLTYFKQNIYTKGQNWDRIFIIGKYYHCLIRMIVGLAIHWCK